MVKSFLDSDILAHSYILRLNVNTIKMVIAFVYFNNSEIHSNLLYACMVIAVSATARGL